jgi:hypothetical protein
VIRWAAEIAGVLALAVAAALWWVPLGIAICGVYLIIVAQVGGDENDSTEDRRP